MASFQTNGYRVLDPDGTVFTPKGLNVGTDMATWYPPTFAYTQGGAAMVVQPGHLEDHSGDMAPYGLNMLRLNIPSGLDSATAISRIQDLIDAYTAKKVVILLDPHDDLGGGPTFAAWTASWIPTVLGPLLDANKTNPYVWLEPSNEEFHSGTEEAQWLAYHTAFYNWVRTTKAAPDTIIVADALNHGQDLSHLSTYSSLFSGRSNLVLAWHNYGGDAQYADGSYHNTTDAIRNTWMTATTAAGIPVQIHEFGQNWDPNDHIDYVYPGSDVKERTSTSWILNNWDTFPGMGGLAWHGTGAADNFNVRAVRAENWHGAWYDTNYPLSDWGAIFFGKVASGGSGGGATARTWWPEGYDRPAFQVRRQVYGSVTGGDYVRGSGVLTLPHTALRYPTLPVGFSTIESKAVLHLRPISHSTIEIEWGWPPNLDEWLEVSLVRSAFGRPSTVNDGQTVMRAKRESYLDANGDLTSPPIVLDQLLPPGRWYYYGLFFKISPIQWARGMVGGVLLPRNFHHDDHLWDAVPPYYRWVDDEYRKGNGFLRQFLSIIAFELDTTREFVESWQNLYNADWSPMRLLRQLGPNFGVDFEAGVGDIRYRALMSKIGTLYEYRGTALSLGWAIELMSKYQCDTTPGIGLSLVPDDSDFLVGTGSWAVIHPGTYPTTWVTGLPPAKVRIEKAPPGEVLPANGSGVMRIRTLPADATTPITVTCGNGMWYSAPDATSGTEFIPKERGIPASPGVSYTFAADVKATKNPLLVTMTLLYFDKDGTPVDLETSASTTPESLADTNWHTLYIEIKAPGAGFIVPTIQFTNRLAGTDPNWAPPIYVSAVMVYKSGEVGEAVVPHANNTLTLGDASELIGGTNLADPDFDPFVIGD